jgi:perosamine synthetase
MMSVKRSNLAIHGGVPVVKKKNNNQNWPPTIEEEIREKLERLSHSGQTASYDKFGVIAEFEDIFASYHGVQYALSHNSGTSALHAAYFALDIKKGDEVIAPTYTFHATVTPLIAMGGVPVFCNLDPQTLNLDPREIEQNITPKTKAIVVTHMWGFPCDMDAIKSLSQKYGLYLIEDCSHAHGAIYKGKKVGTFGDIACFSLAQGKPISAGHGGMFITNNRDFFERAILLGHFGERALNHIIIDKNKLFIESGFGFNYHMSPFNAAIANVYLKYLDDRNEIADENMRYLEAKLENIRGIRSPINQPYVQRACYGCKPTYLSNELDELPINNYIQALQAEGVGIKLPDSKPLHTLPNFTNSSLFRGNIKFFYKTTSNLSISENIFDTLLSITMFGFPAKDIIDQYAEAFKKVADNLGELL